MTYSPNVPNVVDSNNSTTSTLLASASFLGTATDITRYAQVHVMMWFEPNEVPNGDGSTAKGSMFVDFGPDGTNWDTQIPIVCRNGLFIPQTYVNTGPYFRVRYFNDGGASAISALGLDEDAGTPTDQTAFRLTSLLMGTGTKDLGRTLDQSVFGSDPVTLTRALGFGRSPSGNYVDLAPFNDILTSEQIPSSPLGIDEEFTGSAWVDTSQIGHFIFLIAGTEDFDTVELEWSDDGATANGETTEIDNVPITGFNVYLNISNIFVSGRYWRVHIINGGVAQSAAQIGIVTVGKFPYTPIIGTDEEISLFQSPTLTRSIIAGVNPDGDFGNVKKSGVDSGNTTTTPLAASAVWRGNWLEWRGNWVALISSVNSDVAGQLFIDFTEEAEPVDGDNSSVQGSIVISYDPLEGAKSRITPVQSRWVRLRYVNDADAQSTFNVSGSFQIAAPPLVTAPMSENVLNSNLAGLVKAGLSLPDEADEWRLIRRLGRSLQVHMTGLDEEIEIRTNTIHETFQSNVTSLGPTQLQRPNMTNPRTVSITNTNAETNIYIGDATVTAVKGDVILPLGTKDMDTNADIYAIAAAGGGDSETEYELAPDTVDSSSGLTSPSEMLVSDSTPTVFDNAADTATLSGFDGSSITDTEITSVKLVVEAKKESGALGELAAYGVSELLASGNTNDPTPIPSDTVSLEVGHTYFACIARENVNAAVVNVTNTMGFTGYTVIHDVSNGGESRLTVVQMTGTPTSSGTISFILNDNSSYDVVSVISVSNVNGIEDSDTYSSTNSGSFSMTADATENGIAIGFVASEIGTVNVPVTNYTTREQGGSDANDDQTLWVGTRSISATGSTTLSGTTDDGTNDDITGVLITMFPADALDPIVLISHSEGSTQLNQAVGGTFYDTYEQDITGDAAWTEAMIDGMTVTISPSLIGNADLEVDAVWLEVVGSSSVVRVTGSWIGNND